VASRAVPVRGEKQQLEDKETHTVKRLRTTKKSKDFLAEQQLNLEEQERTEEDRRANANGLAPLPSGPAAGRTGNKDA